MLAQNKLCLEKYSCLFDQTIGKGGNGTVYKGFNRASLESVAIKIVDSFDVCVSEVCCRLIMCKDF